MLKEFKAFALKGNVMDLAVGVIIGGAFGKIVTSLVNDLLMPIIGILLGGMNLSEYRYIISPQSGEIAEVSIKYGAFLQTAVDFLIIAFSVFLFVKVLRPMKKKEEPKKEEPVKPNQELLLEEIRDLLKKQGK